jgi:c-di-GMP-binding flagellar brake protein YcgR
MEPLKRTEGMCQTKDLSSTGACLEVSKRFEVGERIQVAIDLPIRKTTTVCLEADVIWQRAPKSLEQEHNYILGVTFTRIQEVYRSFLKSYLWTCQTEAMQDQNKLNGYYKFQWTE